MKLKSVMIVAVGLIVPSTTVTFGRSLKLLRGLGRYYNRETVLVFLGTLDDSKTGSQGLVSQTEETG